MLPKTTEAAQVARLVVDSAAGMHVAEPVIEEAIELPRVARQTWLRIARPLEPLR